MKRRYNRPAMALTFAALLGGCNAMGLSTSVGPSRGDVSGAPRGTTIQGIRIIEIDGDLAARLHQGRRLQSFSATFGEVRPYDSAVGIGDVLSISIWEAPPATLFGSGMADMTLVPSSSTTLPDFPVGPEGTIAVPFAGDVSVAGRTTAEIEREIVRRLGRKAHLPQVLVRQVRNAASDVTIVGEVQNALRMPLTPKGERLLDAVAAAGGTRQPIGKTTIQLARDGVVRAVPLDSVIRNPRENVMLRAGDIVTVLFATNSFTVLGATGRNAEIEFEQTGITLAQALGRSGGLQDARADPKGVFLFRWENPSALGEQPETDSGGDRIPVIYRINMKDPATYFLAQNFSVENRDVIYVSNSSLAELQRFANIIASTVLPIVTIDNALSRN